MKTSGTVRTTFYGLPLVPLLQIRAACLKLQSVLFVIRCKEVQLRLVALPAALLALAPLLLVLTHLAASTLGANRLLATVLADLTASTSLTLALADTYSEDCISSWTRVVTWMSMMVRYREGTCFLLHRTCTWSEWTRVYTRGCLCSLCI